MFAPANWF